MKMERITQNCIWRVALSFFVALVLFVHAPLEASATVVSNQYIAIKTDISYYVAHLPLINFTYNSDTGSGVGGVASFSGDFALEFVLYNTGTSYRYFMGFLNLPYNFKFNVFPGTPSNGQMAMTFTADISLVSCSFDAYGGSSCFFSSGTSWVSSSPASFPGRVFNGYLILNFDYLDLLTPVIVSVTFHADVSVSCTAANFRPDSNCSLTVDSPSSFIDKSYYAFTSLDEVYSFRGQLFRSVSLIQSYSSLAVAGINTLNTNIINQTDLLRSSLSSINNNISDQGTRIVNKIQAEMNNDNSNTTKITDKIQAQINNDNSNTTKTINALNANSQAEITAANTNSQNEINAANKNANDIMHDYDTSSQDSDNQKFADSQKELQETEDSLFSDALTGFSALDMSNYTIGGFTAVLGAFSFVSNFLQSLYVKMGDFGTIVTIGLVVMIATKVIGLHRFSTGGDSS